jgi:hypothetical protein
MGLATRIPPGSGEQRDGQRGEVDITMRCFSCGRTGGLLFLGVVDKRHETRHLGPCEAAGMAIEDHDAVMAIAARLSNRVEVHRTGEPEIDELLELYARGLGLAVRS